MPLTPQEKNFVDHLDYESFHCLGQPDLPIPACSWMNNQELPQDDVHNILMLRRWERKDQAEVEEPSEPYAPAWKTGEEAKRRNQELAEEAEDADPTNPQA